MTVSYIKPFAICDQIFAPIYIANAVYSMAFKDINLS